MIIQTIGTHQTWAAFSCIEWYTMHDWQGHPYLGKVMQTVLQTGNLKSVLSHQQMGSYNQYSPPN